MLRIALFAAALCLGIHPALAAPAGLLNKTIHISYGFYIPGKSAVGTTNGGGRTESVILYISSAGRVFGKRASRAARGGDDRLGGPETTAGNTRFEGSSLVATRRFGNAAGQMTVKFDGNFQTCKADFVVGGENGAHMTWVGLNGEKYTQTGPPTFSAVTCSMENGNAFAN